MTNAEDAKKDPCPLGCGRTWHGLPKHSIGQNVNDCPGPWGVEPINPEAVREVAS